MKPPYVKLYVKDFAFEIQGMTKKQIGEYMLKFLESYRQESIPDEFSKHSLFSELQNSLITAILCTWPTMLWAGAWSMNQGGVYAKYSVNHYYTNYTFTEGGGIQRLPSGTTFTDNNTTPYLEYGITNRLTISGSVPYKWLRSTYNRQVRVGGQTKTQHVETHWNGFGDMELGLKYCFLTEPVVSSVSFYIKMHGCTTATREFLRAIIRMIMNCGCCSENPCGRFPAIAGQSLATVGAVRLHLMSITICLNLA